MSKNWVYPLLTLLGGLGLVIYGSALYANPRILIEWQTATEIDTVGFNLYRAEDIDGPYQKINEALIPASNEPFKGASYRYEDANVVPNRVYYYQLEDVDNQGKATQHEPISVQAKPQGLIEILGGVGIMIIGFVFAARNRSRQHISLL
ncbi:MAG: hypothetical protein DDG59_08240 [Anaerolineae bacterium]|nr:MAG: hypothetical protein DDG59_08240 [Anaerolineae bacterium]